MEKWVKYLKEALDGFDETMREYGLGLLKDIEEPEQVKSTKE